MTSTRQDVDLEENLVGVKQPWYVVKGFNCLWIVVLILIVIPIATLVVVSKYKDYPGDTTTVTTDAAAISTCLDDNLQTPIYKTVDNTPMGNLTIQHATLWTSVLGNSVIVNDVDILVVNGIITQVSQSGTRITPPSNSNVIDAQGRDVTPGIVDLHSHVGVYSWPDLDASQDGNEATNPTFPQVRALDAFNPNDAAIPFTRGEGGVTSAQILPGSANLMGGEATVVKFRGHHVQDMLLRNSPRTLKFACGENPKNVYGRGDGITPASRMGSGWLFRAKFEEARATYAQQQSWCSQSSPSSPFPRDLSVDGIVALLRGQAILHNHCYTVTDMETMIRISHEFGFKITAFHHAIEAYNLADKLALENISSAMFADGWGFKLEAYNASVYASKILEDAGATIIIKSDHPVINSRYLLHEAQKAFYYDLPALSAIQAITSRPARALGLENRLGSVQPGIEADLVIWDRDPLVLGARPDKVIIDGMVTVDNNIPIADPPHPRHDVLATLPNVTESAQAPNLCPSNYGATNVGTYAVNAGTVYTLSGGADDVLTGGVTIIVTNGIITCIGPTCSTAGINKVFTLTDGIVIPTLIEGGSHIGQIEIESEGSTQDGSLSGTGADGSSLSLQPLDGIKIQAKHVRAPWAGGVGIVVSRLQGSRIVVGSSVAFSTCCGTVVDDVLIKNNASLHFALGNNFKGDGLSASISGQLQIIRSIFSQARANPNSAPPAVYDALFGSPPTPVVIQVDSVDIIAAAIRLQKEFGFQMIILGGAEAHLLKTQLSATTPPTGVLFTSRPAPDTFDKSRTVDDAVVQLHNAGVKVGIIADSTEYARNLRWEAGFARELGLSTRDAVAAVTANVASLYGLPAGYGQILQGTRANFLLLNGDPVTTLSRPQLIAFGSYVECQPKQV